jgi:hypothetical protein
VTLHDRFGWHIADLRASRWDDAGNFVTVCKICGCEMVKPPGASWRARGKSA